jgi:hypothetical protein
LPTQTPAFKAVYRVAKRLNQLSENDYLWHQPQPSGVIKRYLIDAALLMRL